MKSVLESVPFAVGQRPAGPSGPSASFTESLSLAVVVVANGWPVGLAVGAATTRCGPEQLTGVYKARGCPCLNPPRVFPHWHQPAGVIGGVVCQRRPAGG